MHFIISNTGSVPVLQLPSSPDLPYLCLFLNLRLQDLLLLLLLLERCLVLLLLLLELPLKIHELLLLLLELPLKIREHFLVLALPVPHVRNLYIPYFCPHTFYPLSQLCQWHNNIVRCNNNVKL